VANGHRKEIIMDSVTDREERVEVHGLGQTSGLMVNLIMKAPGISQFVEPYRAYRDEIKDAILNIRDSASGCPKVQPDGWMDDCDGGHPVWNAMALLRRGALKEPTKSGANAGQKRDPSVDFNYKWEVAAFIDGPSPKKISTNGKDVVEAKLDDATVLMLQREFISNDRTALMQAVAFGASDTSNILTDQEVTRLTSLWGDLLNERALSRVKLATLPKPPGRETNGPTRVPESLKDDPAPNSPLVQAAVDAGAVISDIQPVVHNIEDVKKVLAGKGVTNDQISRVLKEGGYERGSDWLKKHGDDYSGLLSFVEEGLSESW
jgi:hypothetical protein